MSLTPAQISIAAAAAAAAGSLLYLRSLSSDLAGDFKSIKLLIKVVLRANRRLTNNTTIPDYFEERLQQMPPDAVFLHFIDTNTTLTWKQFDAESNRVANWALAEGIRPHDVVVLMLENTADYYCLWMGLAKVGVTTALINSHLRGQALLGTLQACKAKRFLVGNDLVPHVVRCFSAAGQSLGAGLPSDVKWFSLHGSTLALDGQPLPFIPLSPLIADAATYPIPRRHRASITPNDSLLHIYTSGTTGLPKAAHFSHLRMMMAGELFADSGNMTSSDRLYTALPFYHSAGGVIAPGLVMATGMPLTARKKHSTSAFWTDCVTHKITIVQYIGELCRYLLHAPPHPDETRHAVRLVFGNGMRPEVWVPFQKRFNIPGVFEFYGATEGNASMGNPYGKPGAVGRVTDLMMLLMPLRLVRVDDDRETPLRDASGRCIPCKVGQIGELIGRIENDNPLRRFQGYTSQADTEKKILRDVLVKGDAWFRSGDLLTRDADGYMYFVDRIGDTFRWRGENCSTEQVQSVIATVPGVLEANVYGVKVFEQDGRAGMAALVVDPQKFSLPQLYEHCRKNLPSFASPLFVRLLESKEMDLTTTFKLKKTDLMKEGFDPARIKDPLFFRDDQKRAFVPLDAALHAGLKTRLATQAKL